MEALFSSSMRWTICFWGEQTTLSFMFNTLFRLEWEAESWMMEIPFSCKFFLLRSADPLCSFDLLSGEADGVDIYPKGLTAPLVYTPIELAVDALKLPFL